MYEVRTVCIPQQVKCHVQYFVWAVPETDPHFAPESPYVVENKYFETKAEAEQFKETLFKGWTNYYIKEKITPEP